ncbi:MAG TPA: Cof-type HAD-IIB family hydrolase [Candidatus Aquilonibacter sp.]
MVPSIDLIALDLDGTLLDPSEAISPANRSAIAAALDRRVHIVLVTGRGSDAPLAFARDLALRDPLICAHGAMTKDVRTGRDVRHVAIAHKFSAPLLRFAHEHQLDGAVYVDERFHRRAGSRRYMDDMQGPHWVEIASLLELADREPTFIRFFGKAAVDAISAHFAGTAVHFKFETWGDFEELAITSLEATKERALAQLCADLHVPASRVLAIGDSRNDVPMLRWAGVGVAMANALPEVIEAVPNVTTSNDEDGVARAIERFVLTPDQERRSA